MDASSADFLCAACSSSDEALAAWLGELSTADLSAFLACLGRCVAAGTPGLTLQAAFRGLAAAQIETLKRVTTGAG